MFNTYFLTISGFIFNFLSTSLIERKSTILSNSSLVTDSPSRNLQAVISFQQYFLPHTRSEGIPKAMHEAEKRFSDSIRKSKSQYCPYPIDTTILCELVFLQTAQVFSTVIILVILIDSSRFYLNFLGSRYFLKV